LPSLERERIPSFHPVVARDIPLIDRVEEMKLLKETVDRTIQGEGGLVFLYGEAGIGKTRLARELRAYAHQRGMQVLYGRCPALFRIDGVPPYILWSEVIRDYLDKCSLEQLYRVIGFYPAEVAKLVPELVQKLRAIPQSFPISPEQEQNRLFEAVSQFITNISRETPLLVVLDDLQWTDPSSLLLLHYLARGVQKTPLLILGAYRSTDIDAKHPLSPVLAELNRERLPQSVSLKRMSLNDISEMIKQILEQDDVPTEFCKAVYEKTRGNPFFAEEVVKSLKEEEIIHREQNRWEFKETSEFEFPETVRNVVKARFSRLDEDCQNVLTLASFVGNDFTLEAMCAVTGVEESKLLELMDKAFKTGLIKERLIRGEGICSFADTLVRDVVYEEVSPLNRKKLHGVAGVALEKVYANKIDEHFGELALHFLEGGDKGKALDYFLKAGEKAQKTYANSEAASYYQSALRLLEEKEGEIQEKGRVLEQLGGIKKLVGEYDACMKYWSEALLLFKQLKKKEAVARLYRRTANVLWSSQGDTEKAKTHYDEALKILEKEPENAELASLFDDMARLYLRTADVPKARSWTEKAIELAEKTNACEVIASSYSNLGDALSLTEDMKKAAEYYRRALKIALDNNYTETAIRAYSSLSTLLPSLELGAVVNEKSFELLEKAYELAKKAGDVHWVSFMGSALADAYWGMGNMGKAMLLAEESVALGRKTANITDLSYALNELGCLFSTSGEWDKSEQLHREALSLAQKAQDTQQILFGFFSYGLLYVMKGEWVRAREQLEKAIEVAEKTGARYLEYWYKCCVAWPYLELGEIEKAKNLLENVLKFAFETKDIAIMGCADSYMAMLFCRQKKWKESITFFEKSLQEYETFNASRFLVYWFARQVLYEYARMYLERDQLGDREKADKLLSQALEMFQKMGAKKDIEKTMKLMEALHPPNIQTQEKTVSPGSHVCDEVQCNVIAAPRELKVGENLELEIELTGMSEEGAILLTKIVGVIPEGFGIVKKPEVYRMEENCLNMKGKRLGPQETEIVKLVLISKKQGTFHIEPKILFIDASGKEKTLRPKSISITVKELGIKGWLKGER
jgi:tetratricopeptide (TPR) repeat protein